MWDAALQMEKRAALQQPSHFPRPLVVDDPALRLAGRQLMQAAYGPSNLLGTYAAYGHAYGQYSQGSSPRPMPQAEDTSSAANSVRGYGRPAMPGSYGAYLGA